MPERTVNLVAEGLEPRGPVRSSDADYIRASVLRGMEMA